MGDIIASDEEADKPPLVKSSCPGLEMTGKVEGEESAAAAVLQAAPTYNPYYCLHPNIEMKKNRLGKGLYATATIYEGETIYNASKSTTLARVDSKTIQTWPAEQIDFFETYSWQVGDDLWSGPTCKNDLQKDYVNYLNHSCDPNTWFAGDEVLVARRDIQPGEEITYDYATSDIVVAPFLVQGCLCGSAKCRKRISPWDYRLPSLQAAYGEHFMPYILEHIATEPKLELGTGMYASLHKAVELKPSPCGGYKGLGLFASDLIPLGTIVWCAEHEPVESAQATVEEIASFSKDKKEWFLNFGYQVDKDTISSVRSIEDLERDAGYYMNHSCDPNLWFVGDKLLVASRDIHPGEELTYDYGTNSSLFERISECKCGAPECRGRITTKDYLLPQLQERYNHHFSLFILADILNAQN